jgi:hypothetical protein
MRWTRALAAVVIAAPAVLAACKSGEDPSAFSIQVSTNHTAELLQGASGTLLLTITRNNFDKDIELELVGTLPEGVTTSFSQNPVPSTSPTVNIAFTIPAASTPAEIDLSIKASAEGTADVMVPITLKINVRGSHTLSLPSSTLTVAQGGGGTAAIRVNRVNSNAGSVTLSATAPAGITATFSGSPTTGTGATVVISAGASLGVGNYPVTITAAQAGVTPDPQVTLTVTVVAAKTTTNVSLAFCNDVIPTWFAFQNEGFNWKQQQPSGNLFTFAATDNVAIAYAFDFGTQVITQVQYATRQELALAYPSRDCFGSRVLTGTSANVGSSQTAAVVMGLIGVFIENNAFTLDFLPAKPLDLVAVRGAESEFTLIPDKMIVRRGVATASGALPVLDFAAAEAFEPVTNTVTLNGLGSDFLYMQTNFGGATGSFNRLFSALPSGSSVTTYSLPADKAITGDLHQLYVETFNTTTFTARLTYAWYSTAGNRTVTLSPTQNTPTISVLGTGPYARFRGQLASQAEYNSVARFVYIQTGKAVQVEMTAGFAGGTPTTWDVSLPDMTAANGFNVAWMPAGGATTRVITQAYSGRPELVFSLDALPGIGADPVAGDQVQAGFHDLTLQASAVALRAESSRVQFPIRPRREQARPQYLRR